MTASYNYGLVALSVAISIFAAYAALDLAGRTTASRGRVRLAWLAGGAAGMGLGIWSMHYIGMLAFRLPVPVLYDWPTVLASLLIAIFASAVALFVVSRRRMGWARALTGSAIMGGGIATMHYIGMAAMRLPAMCHYDLPLLTLSVVLAIVFSLGALWLSFHLREDVRATRWRKCASAVVMGAAIALMHYTGMAAARFTPWTVAPDVSHAVHVSSLGIAGISSVTLLVLSLVVGTSLLDRRFSAQTAALEASELLHRQLQQVVDELKKSEDQLRVLIETIPALAWTSLPDGSCDFVNQRWVEYTGLSLDQIQGTSWATQFHPEDIAVHLNKWRSAMALGETLENEVRIRRGGTGEYRWFLIRALPLRGERGNIVKWYGTMTDIEDRKRAEEALRQAHADLAHVTRVMAMGELAASIVHEVSQPLSAVVINGQTCLHWLAGSEPNLEEAREAVQRILLDGKRAREIIVRIRALSRKAGTEKERLDMNEVIEEVVVLAQGELRRNSVAIRTKLAADLMPVLGDRVQIQQVVLNFIMNGIEAMRLVEDRQRELAITTQQVEDDQVCVAVQDSGIGLDPKSMEQIFDAFYTTKREGMGMGLSISRSIVSNHGGRLWAIPNDGPGATFQFTLPKYH
jgi:PAS domain S-box-containing protein